MEVDQKTFFPPNRHDHSKHISYPKIVWRQNGAQIFPRASRSRIDCPFAREKNVTPSGNSRGRPSPTASQLSRLEVKHSQHWPSKGKQRRCRVCSLHKQTRSTLYFCKKCDVGLYVVNCFEKWHTRVNLATRHKEKHWLWQLEANYIVVQRGQKTSAV